MSTSLILMVKHISSILRTTGFSPVCPNYKVKIDRGRLSTI